jgi:hypothetical protein
MALPRPVPHVSGHLVCEQTLTVGKATGFSKGCMHGLHSDELYVSLHVLTPSKVNSLIAVSNPLRLALENICNIGCRAYTISVDSSVGGLMCKVLLLRLPSLWENVLAFNCSISKCDRYIRPVLCKQLHLSTGYTLWPVGQRGEQLYVYIA